MGNKDLSPVILGNLVQAVGMLQKSRDFSCLMPEVRVNIVHALPGAESGKEVAAIDGRITVVRGYPFAAGLPAWGASDHMARLIIEVRKYKPEISAGINFKCDKQIIEIVKKYARERKLSFGKIDRTREPEEVSTEDGSSMPWKIKYLVERYGEIPALFYEGEGWGKEPLFVALGNTAVEVAGMAIEIARRYRMTAV
ncbi:MAG: phosphomethylpyrimidine kinase [Chloroflexi bacterium]|nr:phosphomethylpyrimidine kinase [Chloroflexota bacterium]